MIIISRVARRRYLVFTLAVAYWLFINVLFVCYFQIFSINKVNHRTITIFKYAIYAISCAWQVCITSIENGKGIFVLTSAIIKVEAYKEDSMVLAINAKKNKKFSLMRTSITNLNTFVSIFFFLAGEGTWLTYFLHVSSAICSRFCVLSLNAWYITLSSFCEGLCYYLCATITGCRSSSGIRISYFRKFFFILIWLCYINNNGLRIYGQILIESHYFLRSDLLLSEILRTCKNFLI